MRRALPAAALALIAPASASAAPFGEPASRTVPGGASCLFAPGEPGTLAYDRSTLVGRPRLLRADATGLQAGAVVPATPYAYCAELELRPNGTGIAAYNVAEEIPGLRAVLRTGGTWGAAGDVLGDSGLDGLDSLAAASSDAGAAVVVAAGISAAGFDFVATRRAPGGAFGPSEKLLHARGSSGIATVRAGVTAAGETVVAWSLRPRASAPRELWAAYARPGGPFAAPVRVGTPRGPFALAVGDGGHALLAFRAEDELRVAERAPGAGFGPATPVGVADDPLYVFPAAAVRADGAAVVAWIDYLDGAAYALTRPGPGAFGAPVQLARRLPLGIDRDMLEAWLGTDLSDSELGREAELRNVAATFAGDRALVAWATTARRDGVYSKAPSLATLALAGGPAAVQPLGNGLTDVPAVAPFALAGGTPAVAWTDEGEHRVHLAVEGAADAADPPAPRIRIGAPKQRVLTAGDPIELPVSCSAACDVRASATPTAFVGSDGLSLRRAGSRTLKIGLLARLDGRPVPVHVRWGAPGTRHPQSRTVMVRVRRKPGPPLPQVRGVRARRAGDDVVVTWRTERDADKDDFLATAGAERRGAILAAGEATGARRRFRARIRDVPGARYVTVLTGADTTNVIRRTTVEIN